MSVSMYRKSVRRGAYAWPGGYPMYLMLTDGSLLCTTCERENRRRILEAARDGGCTGWEPELRTILWEDGEDGPECCEHCFRELPSAYGEVVS